MKNLFTLFLIAGLSFILSSCEKEEEQIMTFDDVYLTVAFNKPYKSLEIPEVTAETPSNYYIAIKRAELVGKDGTESFELFNRPTLEQSYIYDYFEEGTRISLYSGTAIPDGNYSSLNLEIYYLQMKLNINTTNRGLEARNWRFYLSDDAENEGGLHQPGDITQISSDIETGWVLGEGQTTDLDPVSPRSAAYTVLGDGVTWYDFNGKDGMDYGPLENSDFWYMATHPVYTSTVRFNFKENVGDLLLIEFNVMYCWQYSDISGDGYFGADDLATPDPADWTLKMPVMSAHLE